MGVLKERLAFEEVVGVARAVLDERTPITSGKAQILARWVVAECARREALRLAMLLSAEEEE